MLASLAAALSLALLATAQIPDVSTPILFDIEHNATSLIGVWSTGAGLVETGVNFVDVKNGVFNPPPVAGMSYSFTGNGDFEMVEFRFESNRTFAADLPGCPDCSLTGRRSDQADVPWRKASLPARQVRSAGRRHHRLESIP